MIQIVCTRKLAPFYIAKAASLGIFIYDRDFLNISLRPLISFEHELIKHQGPFIFTSVHAVNAVQKSVAKLKNNNAFAIQGTTAQTAKKIGFKILGDQKNTLELAKVIALTQVKSVLHCTTQNRREELEKELKQNNIQYKAVEVYNKSLNSFRVGEISGIMFFSPSQIESFMLSNNLKPEIPAFCIGNTTANYLRQLGHLNILVAHKPTVDTMFNLLLKYFNITKSNE